MDTVFKPIADKRKFKTHEASIRDYAAFTVVQTALKTSQERSGTSPHHLPGPVVPRAQSSATEPQSAPSKPGTIGIIGAGAAGLYTAMILQSLGVKYEILEANKRIGGRLFTHRFNGEAGVHAEVGTPARYDYFDVGAMRFPEIPFMRRVFDLFDRTRVRDLLVDYQLSAPNTFLYYNSVPPVKAPAPSNVDTFRVSVKNGGTVPNHFAQESVDPNHWTGLVFDHYKEKFKPLDNDDLTDEQRRKIFAEAWAELTRQDHHTTRSAMRAGLNKVPPYPNPVIEWLETFGSATGQYDSAFVETVMGSLDFDWPWPQEDDPKLTTQKGTKWWCIDGGSDHIARKMAAGLNNQPILNKKVTKISLSKDKNEDGMMEVTVAGETKPRTYSQVISTVTLGCLSAMDIKGCNLRYSQKQAIRSLRYEASTKVGIKFETRWWQDPAIMPGEATIFGGQSKTDVPLRTCVYPSYGVQCEDAPGILLASYTFSQDALRLGAISAGNQDIAILDLTLDNLSKLHGIPRERFGPVLDFFAHSFYADPYTRGAFAHFGPGQFGHPGDEYSLFVSLKAPAPNGKFHVAGEATSAHHGWVLGALNSAWRAVYNALDGYEDLRKKMIEDWGIPDEEDEVHLKWLCSRELSEWL